MTGKNTLTVDVDGSNLNKCWIEMKLSDGSFEEMVAFDESDLEAVVETSPDGTAVENIESGIREGFDIMWASDERDELLMWYGANNGGSGTEMYRAESPEGDPTSFGNEQLVFTNPTSGEDKAESPAIFYDRDSDTLYMYYEHSASDDTGSGHGYVGIAEADSRSGLNWSHVDIIGDDEWDHSWSFASPEVWKYEGEYFIAGEEHTTGDRDLMVAKGPSPDDFNTDVTIAADSDDFDFDNHIALKGTFFGADGNLYTTMNPQWDDGSYNVLPFWSGGYDNDNFPTSWSEGSRNTEYQQNNILFLFNQMYVYGFSSASDDADVVYWKLDGTRVEKSLPDDGGQVSFDFYQTDLPPGSTVEWRAVVQFNDGATERTNSETFTVS